MIAFKVETADLRLDVCVILLNLKPSLLGLLNGKLLFGCLIFFGGGLSET